MRCPRCKEDDVRVVDSRTSASGSVTRRRRQSRKCSHPFTPNERIGVTTLREWKKTCLRFPFDLESGLKALLRACRESELVELSTSVSISGYRSDGDGVVDGHWRKS